MIDPQSLSSRLPSIRAKLATSPGFGSTIVDGPEVYEDRDPAQGIYAEFTLLDFLSTKKYFPNSGHTRVELHVGHTHGLENAPYSLLLGLCFPTTHARETVHTRFALCPAAYSCSKLQGVLGLGIQSSALDLT